MTQRYASDLSDDQWSLIESLLPQLDPSKGGRPRTWELREIFNAIFYIEKTGCQWRMIPKDLPPKETVWGHFRQWRDTGVLEEIRLALNNKVREKTSKKATPSVLITDSQSVKTAQKGGIAVMTVERASREEKGTFA
jgi:transposase